MSKESDSLLFNFPRAGLFPSEAEPGKGRWLLTSQSCGQRGWVPAGEVPLQTRDGSFQRAVMLSRRFPELGADAAPTERDGSVVPGAGAARRVPMGEVKPQLC